MTNPLMQTTLLRFWILRAMESTKSEVTQDHHTGMDRQTSKPKGVYRTSWGNRWFAQIRRNGKLHYLGTYEDEEKAAAAYESAAKLLS